MSFKSKELIQVIVESDLDNENKIELLNRIYTNGHIKEGYYLKGNNEQGIECWYRNGTDRGPTNFTPYDILDVFKEDIKKKRR